MAGDTDGDGIADSVEVANADLGFNPAVSDASILPSLWTDAEYDANRTAGQTDVTGNPGAYNLYTTDAIMDLRTADQITVQAGATTVDLRLPVEKTTNLIDWTPAGDLLLNLPKTSGKEFYRIKVTGAE